MIESVGHGEKIVIIMSLSYEFLEDRVFVWLSMFNSSAKQLLSERWD